MFFRTSGTLKKGVWDGPKNSALFFFDFGGLAGGENSALVLTRARFSLWQLDPKGLQHGSQNEAIWGSKSQVYQLWVALGRFLVPKWDVAL